MKRQVLLHTLLSFCACSFAQTQLPNDVTKAEWGASNSNAVAVDVDNDGFRDMVFAGIGTHTTNYGGSQSWDKTRMCHVARFDPSAGQWSIVGNEKDSLSYFDEGISLNVADRPSLSVCDMNHDGIMDIVAFDTSGRAYDDEPYLDNISHEGIFLGNGDGTFEPFQPQFVDSLGNATEFDMRTILSGDVADFNNDGLMDIAGIGYQTNSSGDPTTYFDANVALINQGGGVFRVTRFFTDNYVNEYGQDGKTYHFECGFVLAYDFNNDGWTDFIVCSNSNDRSELGTEDGSNTHFTDIFLNDPDNPGQFRRQYLTDNGFPSFSDGGIAVADYNNDGTPDIFLSGWKGDGRGTYAYGIYIATIASDGSVSYKKRTSTGLTAMRGQSSTSRQYGAMDWDGDGNFDLFNLGWSPSLSTQTCLIGLGKGSAKFSESLRVGGGSEGCVAFVDWNGDGVNDYVTVSQSSDTTFYAGAASLTKEFSVTCNPNTTVSTPSKPANVAAQCVGGKVVVTWDAADDAVGNETYEYYVKTAGGKLAAGGNSFIGGTSDGLRKVNQQGNACNARSVTLQLPDGDYVVGVQTVNAALNGSPFATVEVSVTGSSQPETNEIVKPEKTVKGETFTNPVVDWSVPDPTVMRDDDGLFYLYGTEDERNVPVLRSSDLINWALVGHAFIESTRPTMVPDGGIWAPDINKIGDNYVLYFSKSEWGGEETCGIGCATSTMPNGNFRNSKKLFLSSEIGVTNSIDPFYIEDDGKKYLFWGSFRGIYAIELSDDGLSLKDGAEKQQIAGTAIEGTYVIKHGGYYYLFGSAGSCCDGANSTYHVLVARSESLLGPYVNKVGEAALDNGFSNFLYRSPDVIAPGHNSEIITDDAGQDWILYHGYDANDVDAGRKVYLSKVNWDKDGWPMIENMRPALQEEKPVINGQTGIEAAETAQTARLRTITPKKAHDKIDIAGSDGEQFEWRISSAGGETVMSGHADGHATVSVSGLARGLYIVSTSSDRGSESDKIVKY